MRADPKTLRAPLLRWYRKHKRDLPWRRTTDPYAIWVSEAMLQQTTVAAVIPYWNRFLARFPNVAALARANEEDVLASWTGLGYYRRAKALREGAIAVLERHRGMVPGDRESLLALPGIGPYTAGAIASVAFGHPEPVVDGNVKRVFSRLFAIRKNGATVEKKFWRIARALVEGPHPGDLNQAVMELGATVCTPRSPECSRCPVAKSCRARSLGRQESFPAPPARKPAQHVGIEVAWIERGGRILLERRHPGSPLRGTWDLPVLRGLPSRIGLEVVPGNAIATVRHSILTKRLTIQVSRVRLKGITPRTASLTWIKPAEIGTIATSAATTKAVQAASSTSSSGSSGRVKRYDFPSIKGTAPKAQSSPAQ
ncbi:MAG TPA: A/G-specific adenine glycosylase [Candidatus Bathyarchaeia archaeon]|nr:A/G-specific adenine glycosylase [Candidatus Bathyarchaeia archaeon]